MGLGGQEDPLSPKRSKTQNTIKFLGLAFLEVSDLTQNTFVVWKESSVRSIGRFCLDLIHLFLSRSCFSGAGRCPRQGTITQLVCRL